MATQAFPILGAFNAIGPITQTQGTVIAMLIPPFGGQGVLLGRNQLAQPNILGGAPPAITHVKKVSVLAGSTAHKLTIMRPFNWTTVSADAAYGQAVLNITADPGLYATAANWKRTPFPNGAVPSIANNTIAAADYVVYQNADGTWTLDTVASVATLAITMTTNLGNGSSATGTAVKQGAPFYWYGVVTDKDPSTGQLNPQYTTTVSVVDTGWSDSEFGVVASLYPGDPLILYDPNSTAADTINYVSGIYAGV